MTLDHYAPCPCGNGKKIKFCKCIDQPQEYEKIVKLIEGEQNLAAIDRINQLLEKTPNTAWLLAIKGELTLGMQEFDSFIETASRLHKLKPDNPLGMVMMAISASIESKPAAEVGRYLLEGLSETRESVHPMTLMGIRMLIQAMSMEGLLCMVGFWSDVFGALSGEQAEQDLPTNDPSINLLAKTPSKIIDEAAGNDWSERLEEVISLTKTFRYAQAENKLRSILRDFPDQPGPLSHLLRAQCALLDQQGAYETAMKLAENLQISVAERAHFRAIAFEVEPDTESLQTGMRVEYCEVDSEERIEDVMDGLDYVEAPESQSLEEVRRYYAAVVGDEVPAKRIFSIFDRNMKEEVPEGERIIASSVGSVILYGKQTDKPARVLFIANSYPAFQKKVEEVHETLVLGEPIEDADIPMHNDYAEFLNRPHVIVGDATAQLTLEERGHCLVDEFLSVPLAVFDNKSPQEVADDERCRADLLALLFHLEGDQSFLVAPETIDSLFEKLGLERPTVTSDVTATDLRLTTALDMDRLKVADLPDLQLQGLMVRTMSLGATRVFYACAMEVRSRESCKDNLQLQVAAMSGLMNVVPGIQSRIDLCVELEEVLVKANAPVGRVVIQRINYLQMVGRENEAREALQEAAQKYPNDPYLMSFIQYAMQSQQQAMQAAAGGDDLAMKMLQNASRAPAPESESGLVLPGSEGGGSSDGESKLWIPGQ